jgi:hypothetical protein
MLPLAVRLEVPTVFSKVSFPVVAFAVKLLLPLTVLLKVIPLADNVGLLAIFTVSL